MTEWLSDMPRRDAFKVGEGVVKSTKMQILALARLGLLTGLEIGTEHP